VTALHHSIIGLPRSGKTTFLAALWHLIDAGEISTKLVLDELVGDHQYLNTIVEAWRRCEEVPRTSMGTEANVAIHFHEPATGQRALLSFPDLSGESFERQFATRTCHVGYVKGFEGGGGIMLFVTADRGQDGITLLDLAPVLEGAEEADRGGQLSSWTPDVVPEQVRLVDLLQFLQRPPFLRKRRRVAVVISAWDVVASPRPSPERWLSRELPFLHEFLVANPSSFEFRVYGVSAQGGDVRGEQRTKLLQETPSQRIQCEGPDTQPHDLTAPIVWLMEGG
jgi:hypothetical protein